MGVASSRSWAAESCQAAPLGYLVTGQMHIVAGQQRHGGRPGRPVRPIVSSPGHDTWVVGDEPVVGLEFETKTAETYARG